MERARADVEGPRRQPAAANGGGPPAAPVRAPHAERLFDVPVRAFELVGAGDPTALSPAEAELVAHASPRRRAEFAAGRQCAHAALAALGVPPSPLLAEPDRGPRWPVGVVGSISHTRGHALAVAARPDGPSRTGGEGRAGGAPPRPEAPPVGIGVDVERLGRVSPELHRMVFTVGEAAWLAASGPEARRQAATVVFAAKEAFYKAQRPWTASWVGFRDVAARPSPAGLELVPATSLPALHGWAWPVPVRWSVAGEAVVVGVTLTGSPPGRTGSR